MKGVVEQRLLLTIPCGRSILFGNLYHQLQLCLLIVDVIYQRFDDKLDGISFRLNRFVIDPFGADNQHIYHRYIKQMKT